MVGLVIVVLSVIIFVIIFVCCGIFIFGGGPPKFWIDHMSIKHILETRIGIVPSIRPVYSCKSFVDFEFS